MALTFSHSLLARCWFLAGPTACGKTAVALELAQRIDAEIVCLDSMTLYRGMDIGTAKPTPAEQARCRHHLLDVIDLDQEYSVAEYLAAAERVCVEILARGHTPLFVGGTGLYLRSVLRGVFQGPAADWELRRRLELAAQEQPAGWLHQRLAAVDPVSAQRLHPRDSRRLIRALEVYELTGRPLAEQQEQGPLAPEFRPRHVYWLSPPRHWLYQRIDQRVQQMLEQGWLAEIRQLQTTQRNWSRTARKALGYQEMLDWLERSGDQTATQPPLGVIQEIQLRTRQFAKRQHTWFRNLEECQAIDITGEETPTAIADRIWQLAQTQTA